MNSSTITDCLSSLFCFLGFPSCILSDRGAPFVSREARSFLTEHEIAFSTSTSYHPEGNSQCERVNQTVRTTIKLLLHGKRLPEEMVGICSVGSFACDPFSHVPLDE